MKSIYELTRDEILSLSKEEVKVYINNELCKENIPITILDYRIEETTPGLITPAPHMKAFKFGSIAIAVEDADMALEISRLLAKAKAFILEETYIPGSFKSVETIGSQELYVCPKEVFIYTKEDIKRAREVNEKTGASDIDEKKKLKERAKTIQDKVYRYIHRIKGDREYNEILETVFKDYLEISDGNKEMALEFMQKAYTFNEETEPYLRNKFDMEPMKEENDF